MRDVVPFALCGLLLAGCFEEGGDAAQNQAVETTVQGLIAFGEIHNNLVDDPGAAGVALLEFMKMPVAAYNLVAPPFDLSVMDSAARTLAPTPVPDCLVQSGEPSCDTYTGAACEAGGFSFDGVMSRRCADCEDPRGFCAYGWSLPKLSYTSSLFSLELSTNGHWEGSVGQVEPELTALFALTSGGTSRAGLLSVCACSTLTVVDSPTDTGKPRKLINSSFLVRAKPNGLDDACALVTFDSVGTISVGRECQCDNGTNCEDWYLEYETSPTCGDGWCSPPETDLTCPADCADSANPRCGDGICQPAFETPTNCPPDCGRSTPMCGNGKCEIGEDAISCIPDCALPL